MLAVVKTPRTNIRIEGEIPSPILSALKAGFGKKLVIKQSPDNALVDVFETEWFKTRKKGMTPGKYMRIYRDNAKMTQEELGQKLGGLSRHYVSDLEAGTRSISKAVAKTLSDLFDQPVCRFL
jgi:DNA-binding XRE family transcriptional regulator